MAKAASEREVKAESEQLEVLLGRQLKHPNIVKTLASGSRRIEVGHTYRAEYNWAVSPT